VKRAAPITPEGESAHDYARRKARYGHRDWLVWRDEQDTPKAAPRTTKNLEQAIRETEERGYFHHYLASTATPYIIRPEHIEALLENTRRGIT